MIPFDSLEQPHKSSSGEGPPTNNNPYGRGLIIITKPNGRELIPNRFVPVRQDGRNYYGLYSNISETERGGSWGNDHGGGGTSSTDYGGGGSWGNDGGDGGSWSNDGGGGGISSTDYGGGGSWGNDGGGGGISSTDNGGGGSSSTDNGGGGSWD
uniref:Uncharacterized protein n=1 Tax=Acrobeloides nanus TaxID=290746 RepID=A0A914EE30_9BILA